MLQLLPLIVVCSLETNIHMRHTSSFSPTSTTCRACVCSFNRLAPLVSCFWCHPVTVKKKNLCGSTYVLRLMCYQGGTVLVIFALVLFHLTGTSRHDDVINWWFRELWNERGKKKKTTPTSGGRYATLLPSVPPSAVSSSKRINLPSKAAGWHTALMTSEWVSGRSRYHF